MDFHFSFLKSIKCLESGEFVRFTFHKCNFADTKRMIPKTKTMAGLPIILMTSN